MRQNQGKPKTESTISGASSGRSTKKCDHVEIIEDKSGTWEVRYSGKYREYKCIDHKPVKTNMK